MLGRIIASALRFQDFSPIGNAEPAGNWSASSSTWAPADGRGVFGSAFENSGFGNKVPNLRGVFLRGINQFDPRETEPVSSAQADPDGVRAAGEFQPDDIKSHVHPGAMIAETTTSDQGAPSRHKVTNSTTTGSTGGPETRPKNVAVFFYIRIN